jgi:LysW-gamma-L-lysine carboxypeptidase
VDRAAEVNLLHTMVGVPSLSGSEQALSAVLTDRMTAQGLRTHLDGAGNFHAVTESGEGPELMLLGHLDTVPGDLPVRLNGDILHGRGSVDAKGPLAAMLCAAARLAGRIDARIHVVGAVEEERGSAGAKHLLGLARPDAVVIGEPSGAAAVGIGYKGVFRYRVEASRPSAHTSSPERTAAEVVTDHWFAARDWLVRTHGEGASMFDRALPSIVAMRGNLETASLDVSCRIPPGFDSDEFLSRLLSWAPGDRVTVVEDVPAVRSSRNDPVVRALSAGIRESGGRAVPKLKLGTSDWNVVGPLWQVPVAAYGPGDSRLCHTPEEHISLTEYLTAIDVLTSALPRLAAAVRPLAVTGGSGSGAGRAVL